MTLIILIHAIIFLAFWLTNLPYQATLNNFLIGATGFRANFLLILMIFAGLIALWSGVRLVQRIGFRRARPAWLYPVVGVFFLAFFYGSFAVLFMKNPAQLYRLGQMLQYFRLFIDAGILLFLAWNLSRWVKLEGGMKRAILPTGLLILWLVPVFWSPGNVYRGTLPEKPRVIAHRGASTLAPENTLASMQAASDLGVYGLETDISVSVEGVLFLMHDSTLARTTDIAQVFPERVGEPAEAFTWDELSHLNAGRWFDGQAVRQALEQALGHALEQTLASENSIPTLDDALQIVKESNLYFIYDLRIPSAGHPYAHQALDLCLEEISTAGVAERTWVLTKPGEIAHIKSALPNAMLAAGISYTDIPPSPDSLVANGYRVVNSVYSLPNRLVRAYQDAGLWVNLWVVDEPWQYSYLWLAGANSVTSNNIQGLMTMPHPVLALPYGLYLIIWGGLGMVAAAMYWWTTNSSHSFKKQGQAFVS